MRISRRRIAAGLILAILLIALWIFNKKSTGKDSTARSSTSVSPSRSEQREAIAQSRKDIRGNANARQRVLKDWEDLLVWINSNPKPSAEEIHERLLKLRMDMVQLDPREAADLIRQLLEKGDTAATGMAFEIGAGNMLNGWPTLRVFLLDVLSATDPKMANGIASDLLDQTQSPDEFATALKSVASKHPAGRATDAELESRLNQLLGKKDWLKGSRGYAEAFDLARNIGTVRAAQQLVNWDGHPGLQDMALHEFAAERPEEVLAALENDNTIVGVARASLMARADPEAPAQVATVDQYLRDPQRSAEEASQFLSLFPLRSATTGYRLYGQTPAPYNFEQIKAGDRAALEQANEWATDPALEKYRPEILNLQKRLTKWIEEAAE